jgi:hypothetical protein
MVAEWRQRWPMTHSVNTIDEWLVTCQRDSGLLRPDEKNENETKTAELQLLCWIFFV